LVQVEGLIVYQLVVTSKNSAVSSRNTQMYAKILYQGLIYRHGFQNSFATKKASAQRAVWYNSNAKLPVSIT